MKDNWLHPPLSSVDFWKVLRGLAANDSLKPLCIDDQTLSDLEIEFFFADLNRTFTTAGRNSIASWLKNPLNDQEQITRRGKESQIFIHDLILREKCRLALLELGGEKHSPCSHFLNSKTKEIKKIRFLFFLRFMSIIPLLLGWLVDDQLILLLLPIFVANMLIHIKFRRCYPCAPEVLKYLQTMVITADKIITADSNSQLSQTRKLKNVTCILQKFSRHRFHPAPCGEGLVNLIFKTINIALLLEVGSYLKIYRHATYQQPNLREMYLLIGEIDALQSIGSYIKDLPYFCLPEFTLNSQSVVEIKDLYLPLIKNAVANDLQLTESTPYLITGTNMSGKSTYLRAVGLSVLLAQSLGFCPANNYRAPFLRIKSSINRHDAVILGKSLYFAEAERLLELLNLPLLKDVVNLILIDEVLSGTNQVERIAASQEILLYLKKAGNLIMATTHDHELAVRLKEDYSCCYFTNELHDGEMIFDYRVHTGIICTTNALKILTLLQFPVDLVKKAEEQAVDLIKKLDSNTI